jgi:hypothetical protein
MSRASMPAAFSVSISSPIALVLASSASRAVAPWLVTPELTKAVSGAAVTSPTPLIEILPLIVASCAKTGVALSAVAKSRGMRAAVIGRMRLSYVALGGKDVPAKAGVSAAHLNGI